jgi:hypothetical protein
MKLRHSLKFLLLAVLATGCGKSETEKPETRQAGDPLIPPEEKLASMAKAQSATGSGPRQDWQEVSAADAGPAFEALKAFVREGPPTTWEGGDPRPRYLLLRVTCVSGNKYVVLTDEEGAVVEQLPEAKDENGNYIGRNFFIPKNERTWPLKALLPKLFKLR